MFDNSLKKDVSFGKMIHLFLVTMHTTERSVDLLEYICNLGNTNDAIRNERSE